MIAIGRRDLPPIELAFRPYLPGGAALGKAIERLEDDRRDPCGRDGSNRAKVVAERTRLLALEGEVAMALIGVDRLSLAEDSLARRRSLHRGRRRGAFGDHQRSSESEPAPRCTR